MRLCIFLIVCLMLTGCTAERFTTDDHYEVGCVQCFNESVNDLTEIQKEQGAYWSQVNSSLTKCEENLNQARKDVDYVVGVFHELYNGTSFSEYDGMIRDYKLYNNVELYFGTNNTNPEIKELVKTLRGRNVEVTVSNIKNYVAENINYQYYFKPRGIINTINTKKGDCTDMAELIVYLLKKEGIYAVTVHGYVNGKVKHDWVEVLYPNQETKQVRWNMLDPKDYARYIKKGEGVW